MKTDGVTPFILVWLFFLVPALAPAQPIPPIDVPIKRSAPAPQDVDLPYKPPPVDILESAESTLDDFLKTTADVQDVQESSGEEDGQAQVKKIDWTTLPFIPFKRPELMPAPDPEY